MSKRILVFTGDGKGKTTAALGMALRAAGHGMNVRIIQFIKADATVGELKALSLFENVTVTQTGLGFVPKSDSPDFSRHVNAAQSGLKLAMTAAQSGEHNLLVLDEINNCAHMGLIDETDVLELLRVSHERTHLVLTGRNATDAVIAMADTVTEMRCIKHGMSDGIPATEGIEL